MPDVQPLSADELADYDAQLVDCGIYYLTATDLARLLYTIKWLQGERDAWEREAEACDETIADRDAELERAREMYNNATASPVSDVVMAAYDAEIAAAKVASDES